MAGRIWVYDISNPAAPVQDRLGRVRRAARQRRQHARRMARSLVVTREGASNRKNGIVFLDTSDPAHPKVVSEYTATVTGGVHSAFIDGHYVYLTDDATGSLRVIDFVDVKNPKEVARWQVENPLARTFQSPDGESIGRALSARRVREGRPAVHGLLARRPHHPRHRQRHQGRRSRLTRNWSASSGSTTCDLYGPGWLAGAHAVFRYKNYVFLGDEVFPASVQHHVARSDSGAGHPACR